MTDRLTRRGFVTGAAALAVGATAAGGSRAAAASAAPTPPPGPTPPAPGRATGPTSGDPTWPVASSFVATARIGYAGQLATASDGDLWPSCWADDDALYTANGDGKGWDLTGTFEDAVVNRVTGTPETGLVGTRLAAGAQLGPVWSDPTRYNRKPTGMVCVDGVLYLALQDLRYGSADAFNDAPVASISRSDDKGRTWKPTAAPMFPDSRFTTVVFLDFGKNGANAVPALGPVDGGYVYAYGLDWNWRDSFTDTVPDPLALYLARVPKGAVQDRSRWTFFTGTDRAGRPSWSPAITAKVPVLRDERRLYADLRSGAEGPSDLSVVSQSGVVYDAPLKRYLYSSWTEYTFEFYESPTPWGPWTLFLHHDAGGYPWFGESDDPAVPDPKNGGYGCTIPSKFISADGRSMWVQSNWFVGNGGGANTYNYNLRRLQLATVARDGGDAPGANLARRPDTVPIEKSAHLGHPEWYTDGDRTRSEDSFDQTNKLRDWWGVTWPGRHRVGRVVFTSGKVFGDGGWFTNYDGGLRVQVRRDQVWTDVGATVAPAYPGTAAAGAFTPYTFRFPPVDADGVRVIGEPGGSAHFSSIAEFEVYAS